MNEKLPMYSFFTALFDILFPPREHEKSVRDATFEALAEVCSLQTVGDTIVLASYHEPLVHACVHEAKFRRNKRAIALLGQLLVEHLSAAFPREMPRDIHFVPIPLSAERLRERGYNQVLEIVRSARTRVPRIKVHDSLLRKIRHTPPQTSLSRAERLKNLNGVFAIGEHAIPFNAHIILFDDIVTTGSTLAEASQTLRKAGFTHIDHLVIAH